jgi:F0F1-type ATP synthase assembly protein I
MDTPDKKPDPQENFNPYRTIGLVSGIGIDLVVTLLAGIYAGKWLDEQMGTSPAFLITGLFVGLIGGIYSTIILLRKFL